MNFITKTVGALILTAGFASASSYTVDSAHSTVGFSVKHLMITNVKGEFKKYDGNIDFLRDETLRLSFYLSISFSLLSFCHNKF